MSLGLMICALGGLSPVRAEVQIDRIYMPHEASPSSFAVGLPGGVSFCFDPLRGAVSYVWTGGFIDASPARPGIGKFIDPVILLGSMVYRESGPTPLRKNDLSLVPSVTFQGYTLKKDAIQFRYTVDGVPVQEEIRVREDGEALVRRLHIQDDENDRWWHVIDGRPPVAYSRAADGALLLELNFIRVLR